ncbi:MAG: LytTR family DNA-binding domain-containing protein [Lentimicrobiaceae bacterium]|nr:LytTR family DNA-binding domain-containing protein [Lentimicrobiaceae bacterium]
MSSKIKIILIEDEPYNLRLLQGMIQKLRPGWEVVETFESVKGSVEWLKSNPHPDLFFMDIQLVDGLCFSIFDQVKVNGLVIFTTAFDNYAIRAFKVNSIDYLLKPFKEKDLEAAIEKFENLSANKYKEEFNHNYTEILDAIRKGEKKYRERFLISKGAAYYMLKVEDIAYFFSENRMTTAVTFINQHYVVDFPLETLENELDPGVFYRASRQLIVNIHAIEKIENYFSGKLKVYLTPPFAGEAVVSRLKATDFKEWAGR